MADMLAVYGLVGLSEGRVGVASGIVGELHGDQVAGIDMLQRCLRVLAVARPVDRDAAAGRLVGPRLRRRGIACVPGMQAADRAVEVVDAIEGKRKAVLAILPD